VNDDQSEPLPSSDALDEWEVAADERERLADERERLADEREALADEREYLADEQERLLDAREGVWHREHDDVEGVDEETLEAEARAALERAEARVERAVAERERARAAVERAREATARAEAATERRQQLRRSTELDEAELAWSIERRAFVAGERRRVAEARDRAEDQRDELADRRERTADRRDAAEAKRAGSLQRRSPEATDSARGSADLASVRDAALRQRRLAARQRERARAERVDARAHAADGPWSPDSYGPGLAAQFALLTRELFASSDLTHTIERIETFALDSVPGCVAAGVAITGGGQPMLHVTTDAIAHRLDALQLASGTGPATEALERVEPVAVRDLTQHSSAELVRAAQDLGILAMVAFGLSVPRHEGWQSLGVLTLYADEPEAFDDESSELAGILAAYLSVAAGLDRDRTDVTRRAAALHRALGSRDVIGQAKGILMERRHVLAGEAFDILRRTSQRLNVRLHELAAQLAETGELPDAGDL
jgi:GAF domain-containing protein